MCVKSHLKKLKLIIQNKFDFDIELKAPYKLCDYKPAYGYLFQEYLEGYEYWGYCDVDMIFGNLKRFLPDNVIGEYDKIGHLGHLSLYKNQTEINTLFMRTLYNRADYQEVFSTDRIWIFDEWGEVNINAIFQAYDKKVFYWNEFCDIYPYDDNFCQVVSTVDQKSEPSCKSKIVRRPLLILWDGGRVYMLALKKGEIIQQECAYAHFQKRTINCNFDILDKKILCTPNQFLKFSEEASERYLRKKRFINKKRIQHTYGAVRYFIIEKTGPIRHMFRRGKK